MLSIKKKGSQRNVYFTDEWKMIRLATSSHLSHSSWIWGSGSSAGVFPFPPVQSPCRCCSPSTCTPEGLSPVGKEQFKIQTTASYLIAALCSYLPSQLLPNNRLLEVFLFTCKQLTAAMSWSLAFIFLSGPFSLSSVEMLLRGAQRLNLFALIASVSRQKRHQAWSVQWITDR